MRQPEGYNLGRAARRLAPGKGGFETAVAARHLILLGSLVEKGATIPVPEALLYRKSNRY
jgi:hypothetical protein